MTESPARKWNKNASYSHCTVNITPFREIMSGNENAARRMEITRRRGLLIHKKKDINFVAILQLNWANVVLGGGGRRRRMVNI
jgi:hypothetical protein